MHSTLHISIIEPVHEGCEGRLFWPVSHISEVETFHKPIDVVQSCKAKKRYLRNV